MADAKVKLPRPRPATGGGYESGPKTVGQLDPPPKTPGVGSRPAGTPRK